MLEQATTITTEFQTALGANFQITTYEQSTTGFCDLCGEQQTGTRENLINSGWFLGANEHFCPECNY